MIETLFEAGADVFRINMSHTPQDRMRALVASIREVERKRDRPIGILADLQGPKLRIGEFAEPAVQIKNGATFVLDFRANSRNRGASLSPSPGNSCGAQAGAQVVARRRQDPP